MIYLTRYVHFNAAHKLYNPKWDEEKNIEVFGKCANTNWHGHNYELIVTLKGEVNEDTGFLIDAKLVCKILDEQVCEKLDHKNLNLDVEFMKDTMSSTENLAIAIWNQITPHLPPNVKLHRVKLFETPRICAEYYGN
ncbi:MAG: 6-carboxytetrahydropterin synthase [Bacteroidetes bacterium]|nr:6-carboxytetrahydropterin synthase [Bacteroidota bacterium]